MTERIDVERAEKMGQWMRLMELLGSGLEDHEVRERMGLTADEYSKMRREAFQFEAEKVRRKSNEEIYVEYVINQARCIKDLADVAKEFEKRKNHAALVSAIRARSEIHDKIIKLGQEFGIVTKTPEQTEHTVKMLVANLATPELKDLVRSELRNLGALSKELSDGGILDVMPGKIHRSLPAGNKEEKKPKSKSKQNRVHRGRRMLRKKGK